MPDAPLDPSAPPPAAGSAAAPATGAAPAKVVVAAATSKEAVLAEAKKEAAVAVPVDEMDPATDAALARFNMQSGLMGGHGHGWFRVAVGQLFVLNAFMLMVGMGVLHFSDWLFHAYVIATFGEIISIVAIIVAGLFRASPAYQPKSKRPRRKKNS